MPVGERVDSGPHDALISVYDKTGVVDFARELQELGNLRLLSTGGTARTLRDGGLEVVEVEDITGFPSMLGGRVKTLHPAILGGILARMDNPTDVAELQEHNINPIDIAVVDLYPFKETVSREGVTKDEAVDQIDIGGVALLRAAAKNHNRVVTIFDKEDYGRVLDALRENGEVSEEMRLELAAKAYDYTSQYDGEISAYLEDPKHTQIFPSILRLRAEKVAAPRYGENPHQKAAVYRFDSNDPLAIDNFQLHQGKEMSFNNYLDMDAVVQTLSYLGGDKASSVVVKHNNPCGAAYGENAEQAFERAWQGDSLAAYGGVVGLNRDVDRETALAVTGKGKFIEVLIAPGVTDEAMEILSRKKDLRILTNQALINPFPSIEWDMKPIRGGLLVQEPDIIEIKPEEWQVVTDAAPTAEQIQDMIFAWQICRVSKSNTIVLAKEEMLISSGVGQQDRKRCSALAVDKATDADSGENRAIGAVVASDAFFPFSDGPEILIKAGIKAIVQPGGSKRDHETIDLCNKYGIAMVFTGIRGFNH